jgi:hypothetical protein
MRLGALLERRDVHLAVIVLLLCFHKFFRYGYPLFSP